MEYQLLAVPFSGFYESEWSDMIEAREQEEKDWLVEHYDVDSDFLQDCVEAEDGWNARCREQIATWFCEHYFSLVSEFTGIDFEVKSVRIDSPRSYNYTSDKLIAAVVTSMSQEQVFEKIQGLMCEHYDELKKIIVDNHTSYSGFISFMSNDIGEWFSSLDDNDHPYLDYILGYITHIKAKEAQWARGMDERDFLNYAIYEAIAYNNYLERPNLVASFKNDEEKWEQILADIKAKEQRRKMEASQPIIPGLI